MYLFRIVTSGDERPNSKRPVCVHIFPPRQPELKVLSIDIPWTQDVIIKQDCREPLLLRSLSSTTVAHYM